MTTARSAGRSRSFSAARATSRRHRQPTGAPPSTAPRTPTSRCSTSACRAGRPRGARGAARALPAPTAHHRGHRARRHGSRPSGDPARRVRLPGQAARHRSPAAGRRARALESRERSRTLHAPGRPAARPTRSATSSAAARRCASVEARLAPSSTDARARCSSAASRAPARSWWRARSTAPAPTGRALRRGQLHRPRARRCSRASCSATCAARSPAPIADKPGRFELAGKRHAVPRRDRRDPARAAGQAPARAAGAHVRARRRREPVPLARAHRRRHPPRSRGDGRGRATFREDPLLPPARRGDPPAAAARAPRGHRSRSSMRCSTKINRELDKNVRYVTPAALALLAAYGWPGNVRELENALTRAVVLAKGDVLDETDLLPITLSDAPRRAAAANPRPSRSSGRLREIGEAGTSRAASPTPSGTSAARARCSRSAAPRSTARSRSTGYDARAAASRPEGSAMLALLHLINALLGFVMCAVVWRAAPQRRENRLLVLAGVIDSATITASGVVLLAGHPLGDPLLFLVCVVGRILICYPALALTYQFPFGERPPRPVRIAGMTATALALLLSLAPQTRGWFGQIAPVVFFLPLFGATVFVLVRNVVRLRGKGDAVGPLVVLWAVVVRWAIELGVYGFCRHFFPAAFEAAVAADGTVMVLASYVAIELRDPAPPAVPRARRARRRGALRRERARRAGAGRARRGAGAGPRAVAAGRAGGAGGDLRGAAAAVPRAAAAAAAARGLAAVADLSAAGGAARHARAGGVGDRGAARARADPSRSPRRRWSASPAAVRCGSWGARRWASARRCPASRSAARWRRTSRARTSPTCTAPTRWGCPSPRGPARSDRRRAPGAGAPRPAALGRARRRLDEADFDACDCLVVESGVGKSGDRSRISGNVAASH